MYPKTSRGPLSLKSGGFASVTARKGCDITSSFHEYSIDGLGGFGFKSPIIKSNYLAPTRYSVYWSEVDHGRAHLVSDIGPTYCYDGVQNQPYWMKCTSQPRPLMLSNYVRALNNYYTPGIDVQGWRNVASNSLGPITRLPPWLKAEFQSLDNKVLLDISKQTHTLAVSIIEMHKTTSYFLNKMLSVAKYANYLKTSKKKFFNWLKGSSPPSHFNSSQKKRYEARKRRQLRDKPWDKSLSRRHMEFNYAVMPVIHDINGILELWDPSTARPLVFSVKKRGASTFSPLDTGGTSLLYKCIGHNKLLVNHTFEVTDPLKFAFSRVGLTPSAFLGTVWELTKFSFLIDWLVKFNALFQGMTALQGVTWLYGHYTCKFDAVEHIAAIYWANGRPTPPDDFGNLDKVPGSPVVSPYSLIAKPSHKHTVGYLCSPYRLRTTGMVRYIANRPTYDYVNSLGFKLTPTRALTIISLLSIFRSTRAINHSR